MGHGGGEEGGGCTRHDPFFRLPAGLSFDLNLSLKVKGDLIARTRTPRKAATRTCHSTITNKTHLALVAGIDLGSAIFNNGGRVQRAAVYIIIITNMVENIATRLREEISITKFSPRALSFFPAVIVPSSPLTSRNSFARTNRRKRVPRVVAVALEKHPPFS